MLIIDRFEGEYAVVEDTETEKTRDIKKSLINESAKEGDVLIFSGEKYFTDKKATDARRKEIRDFMRKIGL